MIFMSQSGLTNPARQADWDRWYIDHLVIMSGVPGISSAQRFKTATPGHPPSLAMYSVASPDVFKHPYYLSVRGMGEWLTLIDKQYYRRNLFDGAPYAQELADTERLIVADRGAPAPGLAGFDWTWLQCVGIDYSTAYRGITVVSVERADQVRDASLAVYRRVTRCYKPQ
jgi:hypothetical protein